jgi:Methyltransferase domain
VTISDQWRRARVRVKQSFSRGDETSSDLDARVQALEAQVAKLSDDSAQVAKLEKRMNTWSPITYSAGLLLARGASLGERVVGPVGFDKLVNEVVAVTRTDPAAARRHLQVAYRGMILAEARSLGRIAGSTLNILGKLVTPRLLGTPNGRVLEIGTLYGVFGGALVQELSRTGGTVELTVVDPLEGVQLQSGKDAHTDVSGTPVSEPVVRRNLEAAGLREPVFRIIRGYSTDDQVRRTAGDRTYGVIVVDGDHSEAGVAADLDWVENLVEPGTVVVLDDYGDARWPGVQSATDKHLAGSERLSLVGVVSTSAFLIADAGRLSPQG